MAAREINGSKPNIESVDKKLAIVIERLENLTERWEQAEKINTDCRRDTEKRIVQAEKDMITARTIINDHSGEIKKLQDLSKNWNIVNSVLAAIAGILALVIGAGNIR